MAQLVQTIDLILASLLMKQSRSVSITQGEKGQSSFLHLSKDCSSTKIKEKWFPLEFYGVLFSVLLQIKEYLFLHELSHVCINVSLVLRPALHYRLTVLSAELDLKKET